MPSVAAISSHCLDGFGVLDLGDHDRLGAGCVPEASAMSDVANPAQRVEPA
jgi:hypothetical protein